MPLNIDSVDSAKVTIGDSSTISWKKTKWNGPSASRLELWIFFQYQPLCLSIQVILGICPIASRRDLARSVLRSSQFRLGMLCVQFVHARVFILLYHIAGSWLWSDICANWTPKPSPNSTGEKACLADLFSQLVVLCVFSAGAWKGCW